MSVNVIKTIVNVATSSAFYTFTRTMFRKTRSTQTLKCKMTLTLIGLSIELMVRVLKWFLSYTYLVIECCYTSNKNVLQFFLQEL